MKSCVSLYSYWKPVRLGEMDQYEVIEKIKALGVDAVELLMLDDAVPKGETMQSYAKKLYLHAKEVGLEVPILSMDSKLYCADPEKELSYLSPMYDDIEPLKYDSCTFTSVKENADGGHTLRGEVFFTDKHGVRYSQPYRAEVDKGSWAPRIVKFDIVKLN